MNLVTKYNVICDILDELRVMSKLDLTGQVDSAIEVLNSIRRKTEDDIKKLPEQSRDLQ